MHPRATFYTVSDAEFFPGTVALLNSLRLTGNDDELVVLDHGLTDVQRDRLAPHTSIVALPDVPDRHPLALKPFPFLFGATGTIVVIDSDMIVTNPLESAIALATEGRVCLFPDHATAWNRWFAEWEPTLLLASPPRRQLYLNSGFVALSMSRWPRLLERWWQACGRVPRDLVFATRDNPFRDGDQDVLNAILMSEVDQADIAVLPYKAEAHPDAEDVTIDDEARLMCTNDGERLLIAHHSLRPKVWSAGGRSRMRSRHPYIRLFPRVVFGPDVPIRLSEGDVPWWLRPGIGYGAALRATQLPRRVGRPVARRIRRLRTVRPT